MQALLCAGLYPNVAATEQGISEKSLGTLRQSVGPTTDDSNVWFDGRRVVHVHPSSVNSNSKKFQYPFLVFLEKVCMSPLFLFVFWLNVRNSNILSFIFVIYNILLSFHSITTLYFELFSY